MRSASSSRPPGAYVASLETRVPSPPPAPRAPEVLDDGKILAVAQSIGAAELDAARLAERRAIDPRVKTLAREVAHEASAIDRRAEELEVSPRPSALAEELATSNKVALDRLVGLQGDDFDRAYVETLADSRRASLEVLDRDLLPRARDGEVRGILEALRPELVEQLSTTRTLSEALGPSSLQTERSSP